MNAERLDLDSFEASKQRLAEIRAAEEEVHEEEVFAQTAKTSRGGRPTKGRSSRAKAAARVGISETEVRNVEKHVSLAEKFPTMQGKDWLKTHAAAIAARRTA